jgi:hypothetical protein
MSDDVDGADPRVATVVLRTPSTPPRGTLVTRARPSRRHLALAAAAVVGALLAALAIQTLGSAPDPPRPPAAAPTAPGTVVHVSPSGSDADPGTADAPLRTIQAALDEAGPGTVIELAPGEYREQPVTVRDGAPGAPITVRGPEQGKDRAGRYQAVLYGTGRVFSIDHSHITLQGFTIDGQERLAGTPFPTDLATIDAFKDRVQPQVADGRLVYIGADETSRDLTGITITNMFLNGAGGECVRMRNNAHDNAVTDSVIQYCGMFGKGDDGERAEYHNGEGVYIGTSPKSDGQPMHANDTSSRNVVARNVIRTFGSECFNVKENAHDNVFEDNVCSANAESGEFDGSNVELRGHDNIVRNNDISGSAGVNIKIKSDEGYDSAGNVVEHNRLAGATAALQLDSTAAQGAMCGNTVATPVMVDEDSEVTVDLAAPC